MIKMINFLTRMMEVKIFDSSSHWRGRLLSTLLLGTGGIALLVMLGSIFDTSPGGVLVTIGAATLLASAGVCFWLNRSGKVILAGSIFLALLTAVLMAVDTPTEVVKGRTLFMFVIPILIASFVMRPYASFIATAIIGILHITLAYVAKVPDYQPYSIAALMVIAMIAWLAARNLEMALENLQKINQELDQRVNDRTRELAIANHQMANTNVLLEERSKDLAMANERLKELDALKSKFVSDVSHELRTPISNLKIYLEMMEEGNIEKNERYLNVLRDETDRLEKLVTDVLNLSRMETGQVKEEFKWTDLNEIVAKVVLANSVRANAKGLDLQFHPVEPLPKIWADSDQINQVINNLVGNAINYTPRGSICVETWLDSEKNRVGLRLKDTGFGIAKDDLPHLFERFYRGQQASQSTIPGTGLGLAITKEIVSRHKGSIEVESSVECGIDVHRLPTCRKPRRRTCRCISRCDESAMSESNAIPYPTFDEFLAAPVKDIIPFAPQTMVIAAGGTRRSAALAGITSGDEYVRWSYNQLVSCFDLFFTHGVKYILTHAIIPSQYQEVTPGYREKLFQWIDWWIAGPELIAGYQRRGWRARIWSAETLPEVDAIARKLDAVAAPLDGPTVIFTVTTSHEAPWNSLLAAVRESGAQTQAEAIRAQFGEDIPPATLFIGSGKLEVLPTTIPPLLMGKLQCYWPQRPGFIVDQETVRAILYDYACTRQTWQKDKSKRAELVLAFRHIMKQAPVVGLGMRLGPFWYPQPIQHPDEVNEKS